MKGKLLWLLIVATNLIAQNASSIAVEGYIIDSDTTGTNIREKPNGKIKKTLHFKDRCAIATSVLISACSNGWLLVTTDDDCIEKITGWMHSSLVFTSVNLKFTGESFEDFKPIPIYLYKLPQKASPKVYVVNKDQNVNIIKYEGLWVYVKCKDVNNRVVYGWLSPEDQCSNPFTTCSP